MDDDELETKLRTLGMIPVVIDGVAQHFFGQRVWVNEAAVEAAIRDA